MKFIFPVGWTFGFGSGTLGLFLGAFRGLNGVMPPDEMKWAFLAAFFIGIAIIWHGCIGLKRVWTDGAAIYVSNYRTEVKIPFDDVRTVTETCWTGTHPITIHLRNTTSFGNEIVFMPSVRLLYWEHHPVVDELLEATGLKTTRNAN